MRQGALAGLVEAGDEPVGGEDRQAGILECHQAHEDVVVLVPGGPFAVALLGVGLHRLVPVVAVGDQQLGRGRGGLDGRDHGGVRRPPDAVDGAVAVGYLGPRRLRSGGGEGRPGGLVGVGIEREDRRDVRLGGTGEPQAVLLGTGVGALVRPHPARAVRLDPYTAEEPPAGAGDAVGARVLLGVGPEGGLRVPNQHALLLPGLEACPGLSVDFPLPLGQVHGNHVLGGAAQQGRPLGVVDHVVGRSDDVGERPHDRLVVVQRPQRLDLGHGGR